MTEAHTFGRNTGVQLHGKGSNWTYGLGVFENGSGNDAAQDVAFTGRFTYAPVKESENVLHFGVGVSERSANASAYNLEVAGVNGAFHYQAEYFKSENVEFDDNIIDEIDGYYLQAGWILTGESRPYKDGKFKIVKPSSEAGAWEAVIRYESGEGNYSDIELGDTDGSQLALGLNYYPNSAIRIGASLMTGENDVTGLDGEEFRVRLQYVYK